MEGEELVVEPPAARPRRRRLLAVLALVVTAAGVALAVTGERREPDERAALRSCGQAVLDTVEQAERRVAAMVSYIAPSVSSSSVTTYEGLYLRVSEQADAAQPEVTAARDRCASVSVWWLNRDHVRTRAALLDLADESLARLARISRDGSTYVDGYERLVAVRETAERRLTAWGP